MAVTRSSRKSRSARSRFNAGLDSLEIRTLLSGIVAQSSNNMNPFQTTPDGSGGVYSTEINTQTFDHAYFDSQGVYHLDNIPINGLPLGVRITTIAYSASDNTLWAAGSDNIIYHFDTAGNTTVASFDPSTKSAQFVNNSEFIASMTVASDGTLWFTTGGSGPDPDFGNTSEIGRINIQQGSFSVTALPQNTAFETLAIAPDGTAWTTGELFDQDNVNRTLTTTSSVTQASWNGSTIALNTFNIADAANQLSNPVVIPSTDGNPGDYNVWFTSSVIQNDFLDETFPDVAGQLDHVKVSNGQVPVAQVNLPGGGTQTQLVTTTASIPPGAQSSLIPQTLSVDSSGTLWIAEIDQTDIAAFDSGAAVQNPIVNAVDSFDTTTGDFSRITTGQDEPFDVQPSGSTVWVTMLAFSPDGFPNGDLTEIDTINNADAGNTGAAQTTSTTITSSASTAVYGQQVTFTAAVVNTGGGGSVPAGTVQFLVDGSAFGGPVSLDATGHASFAGSFISGVSHTIAAVYTPGSNFLGSSASMTQVLQPLALETDPRNSALTDLFIGSSGVLTGDSVQISAAGSSNTGSTGITVVTTLNGVRTQTTYNQALGAIYINLQNGNNNIQFATGLTLSAVITAGNGNNNIHLGNGNYAITLGNGNDNIQAGNGTQIVMAGNGNNNVQLGSGSNDIVILGSGNNNVQIGTGNDEDVTVGNGNNNIQLGAGSFDMVTIGTGGDNIQIGNGSNNAVMLPAGPFRHNIRFGIGFNNIII